MIEVIYSKEDQANIDKLEKMLKTYDESLVAHLERSMGNPLEIKKAFMDDPTRKNILENIFKIRSVMMPAYAIDKE